MARLLQLDVFDLPMADAGTSPIPAGDAEEARLAAYEQGYTAGWDDAVAAQDAETTRLRTELGRNLKAMAATFDEARSHVLRALEPLLRDMVSKVLPAVARQSLGAMVVEQLLPAARQMSETPAEVVAHPANRAAIERLVAEAGGMALTFREEPSLGEGQAYLRIGETELHVDLDATITAIGSAVAAFFHTEQPE